MGRRGPRPTPSEILKLRGTFRQDRARNEPKPPDGKPSCPQWLDVEAKQAWRQLLPMLDQMRVLSRIDRNALARYCQLWSRWKKAELFIQKHGDTYPLKDEKGRIKCLQQFPQVAIAYRLSGQLTRLEQEFGLTPSARTRINVDRCRIAPNPLASGGPDHSRFFGSPA